MKSPSLFLLLVGFAGGLGCTAAPDTRSGWVRAQGGLADDCCQQRAERVANSLFSRCDDRRLCIHVLATDSVSAYGWRDGNLFVTRGLVELLDDQELMAAIAHELGHLLGDGHLKAVVSLRGCEAAGAGRLDVEARADAIGVELLQEQRLSAHVMVRMLQKVEHAPSVTDSCRIALQYRIELLTNRTGDAVASSR